MIRAQKEPETNGLDRISKISGVDELAEILKNRYSKLFKTNTTVHDFDYNVKFKPDFKPVQQKGRIVPIHLQPSDWRPHAVHVSPAAVAAEEAGSAGVVFAGGAVVAEVTAAATLARAMGIKSSLNAF